MPLVDRRAGRNLFLFTSVHGKFYEPINNYKTNGQDFFAIVKKFLPGDWQANRSGIWYYVAPPNHLLPAQGFKIHVSTKPANAELTIERVAPLCVSGSISFKVLLDHFILSYTLTKNYMRGAAGKFITIYPLELEQFKEFIALVHEHTKDLDGPYILSDRRYKNSKVVFYRYGGFQRMEVTNAYGEKMPAIKKSDGTMVPDLREAFFQLPEGVQDPFGEEHSSSGDAEAADPNNIVLNSRYKVLRSFGFSNGGGVYEAKDLMLDQEVIIKEARPHIGTSKEKPIDAVQLLKKEYSIYRRLQSTGYVPKAIDYFNEWEHHYLVQEKVVGTPLSILRAEEPFNALLKTDYTAEDLATFVRKVLHIASELLTALEKFHQHGIIIGDFAPQNVLYNVDEKKLKIIDFEGAYDLRNGAEYVPLGTWGFVKAWRKKLSRADDYYALGVILLSVLLTVQSFFVLVPSSKKRFLDHLVKYKGLPRKLADLILTLTGEKRMAFADQNGKRDAEKELDCRIKRARTLIDEIDREVESIHVPEYKPRRYSNTFLERVVKGIARYILASADYQRKDRLCPADYRVFSTNPLNISYGALGTTLFLRQIYNELPEKFIKWLRQWEPTNVESTPSLYVGSSGIAWAFYLLGMNDKAQSFLKHALESSSLKESIDMFYGTAGVGLTSVYFYSQTRDKKFLEKAIECASIVKEISKEDETGRYWEHVDGAIYYGFAHGSTGVAFFLLKLYEYTREPEHLVLAKAFLDYDLKHAADEGHQLVWSYSNKEATRSPYWRYGSSGIGSVLIRFYKILGDEEYKKLAYKTAKFVEKKISIFPGFFIGLTSFGEFFLDMYWVTKDFQFLKEAHAIARRILLFQIREQGGIAFPGEELVRISTDYGTGSAGIGLFLNRLKNPNERFLYDF